MWRTLHFFVALHWGALLFLTIVEVASKGELARTPNASENFSTATVLYTVALALATVASAARGWWREYDA